VVVGAFCHLGPASALGGGAQVGAGSYLGLGARVRDHVRIGERTLVGMGAVVVANLPDQVRVHGVPARVIPQEIP
jgi:UDP-perosamine 4-acetyltransferase